MKNYLFNLFSILFILNETYICQSEAIYNSNIILSMSDVDCFKIPIFNNKIKECLKPITSNFFDLDIDNINFIYEVED